MKTLTVKQPWAYLICSGVKDIENRTWKCPQKYIGQRVLIHASVERKNSGHYNHALLTDEQIKEAIQRLSDKATCLYDAFLFNGNKNRVFSAIIGSVQIIDCIQDHPSIWAEKDVYNWVLANPTLFDKPILNVKGALSFWDYSNIHSELDAGRQVCMCNLGINEEDQVISYITEFRCKYCGGIWYK